MRFNRRETATLLAALRYWQTRIVDPNSLHGSVNEAAIPDDLQTHFTDDTPLDPDEIDELCEAINGDDGTKGRAKDEVECAICHRRCSLAKAHRHQGQWIGDECCFENHLKASE